MTEKIMITQKQADAIEKLKEGQRKDFETYFKENPELVVLWAKPLSDLSADEYMSVLYDGYEIKPEYKVGDWIYHEDSLTTSKIIDVGMLSVQTDNGYNFSIFNIRHATFEEIKMEVDRRKWAEIEPGDVLQLRDSTYAIAVFKAKTAHDTIQVATIAGSAVWQKSEVSLYAKKVKTDV